MVMSGSGVYVQYGCWKDAPDGWENYDCSPWLRIDRLPLVGVRACRFLDSMWTPFPKRVLYGDIVVGLPLEEGSCKMVYCSHVLEHLSLSDFRQALQNTARLLEPGGVFRGVLPDLRFCVDKYLQCPDGGAALEFMRGTGLGDVSRDRGLKGLLKELLGNSRHRWMWDSESLSRELGNAGFQDIRRAQFGDSSDALVSRVERQDRWVNCLGFECIKKGL
jgi:SAM-dependent methyltransferase